MTDDRIPTDDGKASAAEQALRLAGDEQRMRSDPDFAADVARWRGRFATLHAETEAVEPPSELWNRIEGSIGGRAAVNDNVITLQRRLSRWRAASAGLGALAASLALFLLIEPRSVLAPPPVQAAQGAPMVAMLSDKEATKVVASWDPSARQLVLAVAGDMPADPAHAHELWVIPANGKPRSLGTMPTGKQMHMRLADALATLLQSGATIAISVEPPGGSPTGAPTGPVVAAGSLSKA